MRCASIEQTTLLHNRPCRCSDGEDSCMGTGLLGCNRPGSSCLHACNHLCACACAVVRNRHGKLVAPLCQSSFEELGPQYPLQLFKTDSYGWGVRALAPIPKGGVVAVYAARVEPANEEDPEMGSDYSFSVPSLKQTHLEGLHYGGIARFFNHTCFHQTLTPVRYEPAHGDKSEPRILFVAKRDIATEEELTFTYKKDAFKKEEGGCRCKSCLKGAGGGKEG
jgi:SET domain-containing protein